MDLCILMTLKALFYYSNKKNEEKTKGKWREGEGKVVFVFENLEEVPGTGIEPVRPSLAKGF